jgi:plasmid stabilization system protein ParE
MKLKVWTENAHNERKEILLYWKNHNQSTVYSKKLNELIKKAIQLISAHPHIGRKTDVKNVRVKLVRDYLLFYEETKDTIIILSIWDNRRNPEEAPY